MERLTERVKQFFSIRRRSDDGRVGIRGRWVTTCLLPGIGIAALVIAAFAIYVLLTQGEDAIVPVAVIVLLGVVALAFSRLISERFLRGITEPLELLKEQAERIAGGSFGIRTEKLRDDELGDLTDSLNAISEEIARSTALQSEFISSVSHELRTPLTAITGWAEAMSVDEAIQGDSRRGLDIIYKEASRLTKMVGELLEFTRIQDGRFTLNMETVDIAAEVEDVLFAFKSLLEREEVKLRYTCDEETIPMIEADPERLKQVFLNILDNAVKHGRGEAIEVTVLSRRDTVLIMTRDHGPGIPAEELPHVKERFFKGAASKERGSGIGLAVCDEIVTRHGGSLNIENQGGDGVLVTVRLPVRQVLEKGKTSYGKAK